MEAVAEKIIRPFVDMAKDLRVGLEAHDGGARQMAVHFLSELCHEGQSSWKSFRYGGEAALLVFVDVQIGPMNGGPEENSIGIPLDSDLILAACIDQPSLLPQANFFQQRSNIDTGTDELKVFHEAFPIFPPSSLHYILHLERNSELLPWPRGSRREFLAAETGPTRCPKRVCLSQKVTFSAISNGAFGIDHGTGYVGAGVQGRAGESAHLASRRVMRVRFDRRPLCPAPPQAAKSTGGDGPFRQRALGAGQPAHRLRFQRRGALPGLRGKRARRTAAAHDHQRCQ